MTGGEGERMRAKVLAGAMVWLDGALVDIDVAHSGLPHCLVIGQPAAAVREADG